MIVLLEDSCGAYKRHPRYVCTQENLIRRVKTTQGFRYPRGVLGYAAHAYGTAVIMWISCTCHPYLSKQDNKEYMLLQCITIDLLHLFGTALFGK